jgi:RNA polymerase sigma-70 factor, ECF subfamily
MKPSAPLARSKQDMEALAPALGPVVLPAATVTRHHPARGGTAAAAAPSGEAAAVARARAGDAGAFQQLVERHSAHAYGLALRIVRSRPDAEEVAQDAFVRAWRALPAFRGEAAFGTWLHRIVARVALDRAAVLRARAGRERLDEVPEPPAAGTPHDDAAAARARRLEPLVAALPEMQRAAVTLYYWHDRSVADVADALEIPENTVKTHLARARATLRAAWLNAERAS